MHDFSSARRGEFTSRRRSKRRFDDDEPVTAKRVRGRRGLPPIEAFDATDGLPEGDRWSTWDQTETRYPNDKAPALGLDALDLRTSQQFGWPE